MVFLSTEKDAGDDIGRKSFLCARKAKFGLNMQAVSDKRGRILDLSIKCGGSSSDCLAFEASNVYSRLSRGLLAPGLVLFGDNAYINSSFMATPFPNVSSGKKDDYNFFHSQLRIRVECSFGMLVHRWGILRSAIPMGITIQKTVALVNALAKLHNYCIDRKDGTERVCDATAEDLTNITTSEAGYVLMESVDACEVEVPSQLIDGGHHFDDIPENQRRSNRRQSSNIILPRTLLLRKVVESDMTRPMIKRRRT